MRQSLIERVLRGLATVLALASGAAVLILSFAICFDIVARRFLAFSIQGTDEYGGYVLAMVGSLGLSYALLQRGHTRVDIVMPYLTRNAQTVVNIVALVSLLGYAILVAWFAFGAFQETLEFDSRANSPLQTALWVPQALWVAGTWTFVMVTLWAVLNALKLAMRDRDEVNARYGPMTAVQEVEELTRELEADRAPEKRP